MENTFPIVIIPEEIKRIFVAIPSLPAPPAEPQLPYFIEAQKPIIPIEPTSFSQAWGCGLILIIGFIIIMSSSISKYVPWLILAPLIAIIGIGSYHKNSQKEKERYANQVKKYKDDLRNYENEKLHGRKKHQEELVHYNNFVYPNFKKQKEIFEQNKLKILSEENIILYRRQLLLDFFKESSKPVEMPNSFLTGVSEEKFHEFLKGESNNFSKGQAIIWKDNIERYYMPDIIFSMKNTGLFIDIEIDEPYLGSDGTPIHFIGADNIRNKFFLDMRWIVIRFAEEQVVKYPEKCLLFIGGVINSLKKLSLDIPYDILPSISQWTKEDAYKMAFKRSRNTYLPKPLVEKINLETTFFKASN